MAFGIDDVIGGVLGIVNKFIPDQAQRAQAESEVRGFLQAADANQAQVNAAEAQNASSAGCAARRWLTSTSWLRSGCGSRRASVTRWRRRRVWTTCCGS